MPPNQPRDPSTPPPTSGRSGAAASVSGLLAATLLCVAAAVLVVAPAALIAAQTLLRLADDWPGRWRLARDATSLQALVDTATYAIIIAVASVVLAVPAAWVLGRSSSGRRGSSTLWIALIASPLLLPSYLAYAGWGLLRGPNTRFGDWLAVQSPDLSVWVGKLTAVVGMTLWVWPLAALVLAGSVRKLATGIPELALMDAPSRLTRIAILARSMRGGLISALLLVALLITGSAIPLHVAQVPTYAIQLWKVMQLTPDSTGIWVASLPLLLLAAASAALISARITHNSTTPDLPVGDVGRTGPARLAAGVVWALSVLAPLGLFAWSLGSWRSVPMFWRISGAGAAQSLLFAAATGAIGLTLLLATWIAIDLGGSIGRRAAACSLACFLFAGITPGVLVGAAMNTLWSTAPLDTFLPAAAIVVVTHLARFGFVALLGGWWLASIQSREQRWMQDLDAGRSLSAWIAITLRPHLAPVFGIGLATAALSFHEIESTVLVLPPGIANLPQQLLDYLHYARDEQLSAAAVNLLGIGVIVALLAAWLTAGVWRPRLRPANGGAGESAANP